jgi:hypothetical protein
MVVMAVMYGRLFTRSGSPQSATASPTRLVTSPDTAPTVRSQIPAGMVFSDTRKRITITTPVSDALVRDPFKVDRSRFPQAGGSTDGTASASPLNREEVAQKAGELKLQAIFSGPEPVVCIDGAVVRPGQMVGGFLLKRVEPTQAWVQRDGVEIPLQLE